MTIYSKDFCICPWCDADTDALVSHLYGECPRSFGPWTCSECMAPFSGRVNAPGDVDVWKVVNPRGHFSPGLTVLRFDGKDCPTFFVMKADRYRDDPAQTNDEYQKSQQYFFESHSCPTNWLRNCIAVIKDGDTDPHGFLSFVRAIDIDLGFDEDAAEWSVLFPEAFGAPIIDGTISNPSLVLSKSDGPPIQRRGERGTL